MYSEENLKKKNDPQVDVILTNFNKAEFVEEAIQSVINQTYENWKLYIIDDSSKDKSIEVIDKFSAFKNIFIIKLTKNKGPSFCRNFGMRMSKSKYISFLDSDDVWSSLKLEKQISFMEKNNFNFTYTDYTPFFQKNGKKKLKKRTFIKSFFDYDSFIKNSSINTTTMIIERVILGTHRFKKVELLEDYLFKCELLKKNFIAQKLSEDLALYRILDKSRSSKRFKNIYWLWRINRNYNKLNFFDNLMSLLSISKNSLKKYGFK